PTAPARPRPCRMRPRRGRPRDRGARAPRRPVGTPRWRARGRREGLVSSVRSWFASVRRSIAAEHAGLEQEVRADDERRAGGELERGADAAREEELRALLQKAEIPRRDSRHEQAACERVAAMIVGEGRFAADGSAVPEIDSE